MCWLLVINCIFILGMPIPRWSSCKKMGLGRQNGIPNVQSSKRQKGRFFFTWLISLLLSATHSLFCCIPHSPYSVIRPRFLFFHTRLHQFIKKNIRTSVFLWGYSKTNQATCMKIRKLIWTRPKGTSLSCCFSELHHAQTPTENPSHLNNSLSLWPFFLTQRSKDLGLLFTWLTLAAFLVQTQLVWIFPSPKLLYSFYRNIFSIRMKKPETQHVKQMLVFFHMIKHLYYV